MWQHKFLDLNPWTIWSSLVVWVGWRGGLLKKYHRNKLLVERLMLPLFARHQINHIISNSSSSSVCSRCTIISLYFLYVLDSFIKKFWHWIIKKKKTKQMHVNILKQQVGVVLSFYNLYKLSVSSRLLEFLKYFY